MKKHERNMKKQGIHMMILFIDELSANVEHFFFFLINPH